MTMKHFEKTQGVPLMSTTPKRQVEAVAGLRAALERIRLADTHAETR